MYLVFGTPIRTVPELLGLRSQWFQTFIAGLAFRVVLQKKEVFSPLAVTHPSGSLAEGCLADNIKNE